MSGDRDITFDRERQREEEPGQTEREEPQGESSSVSEPSVRMYGKFTGDEWAAYGRGELVPGLNADYPPSPPPEREEELRKQAERKETEDYFASDQLMEDLYGSRAGRRHERSLRVENSNLATHNDSMLATTSPTHSLSELPTAGTSRPWLRSLLTIFGLIVAGGLIWTGLSGLLSSSSQENTLTAAAVPASHVEEPALITAAIKDLRNGMRVLADNPELVGQQVELLDIRNPDEWRNYVLQLPKEDGATVEITLLEPADWLEYMSDDGGKTVYLDLHEMGAVGLANVVAVEPCPPIEPDDGTGRPLITGTFKHTSATVIDLQIEGESQVIGTTANHPFWSVDRNQYVTAGELRLSERLRTANDEITRLISVSPRPGRHDVYNIQVDGEHVYYVGNTGVLVHNVCAGKHHFVSRALGSKTPYGHSSLTYLNKRDHTRVHNALNKFLRSQKKTLPDGRVVDMMPRRGNKGLDIRSNFTKQERMKALSGFYKKFDDGRHHQSFVKELKTATQNGWIR